MNDSFQCFSSSGVHPDSAFIIILYFLLQKVMFLQDDVENLQMSRGGFSPRKVSGLALYWVDLLHDPISSVFIVFAKLFFTGS